MNVVISSTQRVQPVPVLKLKRDVEARSHERRGSSDAAAVRGTAVGSRTRAAVHGPRRGPPHGLLYLSLSPHRHGRVDGELPPCVDCAPPTSMIACGTRARERAACGHAALCTEDLRSPSICRVGQLVLVARRDRRRAHQIKGVALTRRAISARACWHSPACGTPCTRRSAPGTLALSGCSRGPRYTAHTQTWCDTRGHKRLAQAGSRACGD